MHSSFLRSSLALATAAALCAAPARAQGEPSGRERIKACLADHALGQELRADGKLLESREAFMRCAQEQCPKRAITDCAQWYEQLQVQIPSVSLRVTADGESRADVDVYIDDVLVAEELTGKSIEVDPGVHRLRVVLDGYSPFQRELVMSEGDRFMVIEVAFSSPQPPALPEPPPEPLTHRPTPAATYVFVGIGGAAALAGAVLALRADAMRSELERECAPDCSKARVDELRTRALLTDIAWGTSLVSLATAVGFYVLRPEKPLDDDARFDVALLPGGGAAATLRIVTQ